MVTTQMKTDAQRLGNGKKAFNVKQVEKMIEECSTEYTAGAGISISSENAISVDTTTIQEKLTAGNGITITNNVISAAGGSEWTKDETTDWAKYLTNNVTNKELLVYIQSNDSNFPTVGGYFYFPKGASKYNYCELTSSTLYGDVIMAHCSYKLDEILQNYATVYMNVIQLKLIDGVISRTSQNINYYRNDDSKSHKMFLYYR